MAAPLRDQIANVTPLLETLRLRREERIRQFSEIRSQIETIRSELSDSQQVTVSGSTVNDEHDFSVRRLNEYQAELKALQKEKVTRYFFHCPLYWKSACGMFLVPILYLLLFLVFLLFFYWSVDFEGTSLTRLLLHPTCASVSFVKIFFCFIRVLWLFSWFPIGIFIFWIGKILIICIMTGNTDISPLLIEN